MNPWRREGWTPALIVMMVAFIFGVTFLDWRVDVLEQTVAELSREMEQMK